MTENEVVGWRHRLNGHEFEQILGDGEQRGRLAGVLQFTGSQRLGQNLATERQQYNEILFTDFFLFK